MKGDRLTKERCSCLFWEWAKILWDVGAAFCHSFHGSFWPLWHLADVLALGEIS